MNAISYCKWCHGCICLATCLMLCLVQWSQFNISWPQAQLSFSFYYKIVSAIALRTGPQIWMASLEFIVRWPITKKKNWKTVCLLTCNLGNLMGVTLNSGIPSFFHEGRCVCVSLIGFSSPQVCLRSQPNGCLAPGIAASYKRPQTKWFNNQAYGLKVCGLLQEQCVMES